MRNQNFQNVLVIGFLAAMSAATASAAPFITYKLEASPAGAGAWTNSLAVVNGQTYDYRVRFTLAPVGTHNINPPGTANDTINTWAASPTNGLNSTTLSLSQSTAEPIQVDFHTAVPEPPFNGFGSTGNAVTRDRVGGAADRLQAGSESDWRGGMDQFAGRSERADLRLPGALPPLARWHAQH